MTPTAGAILIASGDLARYPGFTISLLHLLRPLGSQFFYNVGLNVAANFNQGIRQALAIPEYDWVWIMGDDHILAPDTLVRLLEHEVDVVVPVCVRRTPPFIPVLFKEALPDSPPGQFPPYHWNELPEHGLMEVSHVGSAGLLLRRHVLESMPDPWFEIGQMASDRTDEDTHFCYKIRAAGYKIYADLDTWIGHTTPITLWPSRNDAGQWSVSLDVGHKIRATLPPQWLENIMNVVDEFHMVR